MWEIQCQCCCTSLGKFFVVEGHNQQVLIFLLKSVYFSMCHQNIQMFQLPYVLPITEDPSASLSARVSRQVCG